MALTRQKLLERRTNDRTPPSAFLTKLHERDRDLDVWWDSVLERWQLVRWYDFEGWETSPTTRIRYFARERRWAPVATLQHTDGSFMDLGQQVFDFLNAADTHEVDLADYIRRKEEFDAKEEERLDEAAASDMRDFVLDNRRQTNRIVDDIPVLHRVKKYPSIQVDGFKDAGSE